MKPILGLCENKSPNVWFASANTSYAKWYGDCVARAAVLVTGKQNAELRGAESDEKWARQLMRVYQFQARRSLPKQAKRFREYICVRRHLNCSCPRMQPRLVLISKCLLYRKTARSKKERRPFSGVTSRRWLPSGVVVPPEQRPPHVDSQRSRKRFRHRYEFFSFFPCHFLFGKLCNTDRLALLTAIGRFDFSTGLRRIGEAPNALAYLDKTPYDYSAWNRGGLPQYHEPDNLGGVRAFCEKEASLATLRHHHRLKRRVGRCQMQRCGTCSISFFLSP